MVLYLLCHFFKVSYVLFKKKPLHILLFQKLGNGNTLDLFICTLKDFVVVLVLIVPDKWRGVNLSIQFGGF